VRRPFAGRGGGGGGGGGGGRLLLFAGRRFGTAFYSPITQNHHSYAPKTQAQHTTPPHNTHHTTTRHAPRHTTRVDEFIVFEPLSHPQIRDIVGLKTAALVGRLAAQRITLLLGDSALDYLADKVGGVSAGGGVGVPRWGVGGEGEGSVLLVFV